MTNDKCRTCEYHKEKWKKTTENGQPLMYVEKVYCPLKECVVSKGGKNYDRGRV